MASGRIALLQASVVSGVSESLSSGRTLRTLRTPGAGLAAAARSSVVTLIFRSRLLSGVR
jgi:hypothetical protein